MKKFLSLISALVLFSCAPKDQNEEVASNQGDLIILTPEQMKNAGIVTGKAEQKNISSVLKLNGVIDVPPQNKVSISVPLGGYLKESHLLPGMHVNKGEVIAIMEDAQYIQLQQDYLTAKSRLTFLEAEFNRQKELNQSKAASDKSFQQAASDFTSQKVLVRSLAEKLRLISINPETLNENNLSRNISISSPITGYVSKVNVNIGKYTKPEEVLFEIVNPEDIHLVLHVFEKDVSQLAIGQKVMVYTNNDPGTRYECEIILLGKDFSADRSVEVHCHFKNYDKNLIPGMFMNAEIQVQGSSSFALPDDAVVSSDAKRYVFAELAPQKFMMTEVKAGKSENGFTEFSLMSNEGIADKKFVTKGAYWLLMKARNLGE